MASIEVLEVEMKEIERRLKLVEDECKIFSNKINEQDNATDKILVELKYIKDTLEKVVKNQDAMLGKPTAQQTLEKEKSAKWDKIIYTAIATIVGAGLGALLSLIIK